MLPIGSIVYLSEGNQKMMILNRGAVIEQNNEKVLTIQVQLIPTV